MGGTHRPSGSQTTIPSGVVTSEETKPLTLPESFEIGILVEYLRRAARHKSQYSVGGDEGDELHIVETLSSLEDALSSSDLETTVTAQVANFRSQLIEKYDNPSESLDSEDSEELEQKAITWEHLLKEALGREQRIPVENTGLLDVDRLIETPEELFTKPVWSWLDERPKSDIREACKTIVIGCSTSSVMLSLRAVEHCLRKWYEKEHEPIEAAWGRVLDRLMEEYAEEDSKNDSVLTQLSDLPPVLSSLYYLKEKRNEVNHPEKSPEPQEARRTLMIVASTISDIHAEMYEDRMRQITEMGSVQLKRVGNVDFHSIRGEEDMLDIFYQVIQKVDDGEGAPREAIFDFGRHAGFTDEETRDILQEVLMAGRAYEPDSDHLKAI